MSHVTGKLVIHIRNVHYFMTKWLQKYNDPKLIISNSLKTSWGLMFPLSCYKFSTLFCGLGEGLWLCRESLGHCRSKGVPELLLAAIQVLKLLEWVLCPFLSRKSHIFSGGVMVRASSGLFLVPDCLWIGYRRGWKNVQLWDHKIVSR